MVGRLQLRRWIRVNSPAHAVTLSGNGQFVVAGSEQGVGVYNLTGHRLLAYPPRPDPSFAKASGAQAATLPVHQLGALPDLSQIYVGAREGWVICLHIQQDSPRWSYQPVQLYQAINDLHSLSVSQEGDLMAIGHFSPGLSILELLEQDGGLLWRRHPEDGSTTDGQVWTVALAPDAQTLYVGSAGSGSNTLAALNPQSGDLWAHHYVTGRVTLIVTLANHGGVVVGIADDSFSGRLVAYDADLKDILWEVPFYEPVTALAADEAQALVAAGVGFDGRVVLLDSATGQTVTEELALKSMINSIALSQGRLVAAGTEDGHVALINYMPKVGRL